MSKSIPLVALVLSLVAPQQVFRSGTELVEVDVVVLDSTGRIVRGLTADDFELYDEGKRQEVSTFSFVEVEADTIEAAGTVSAEPGLSSSAVNRAAGIYLIVLDHLFTPMRMSTRTREAAREFVRDRMRPGDFAAVVHLGLSAGGVEFSGSKAAVLAAIDRRTPTTESAGANPTPDVVPSGGGEDTRAPVDADAEIAEMLGGLERIESHLLAATAEQTYQMLELAAEYVAGFTGRRKSMLLFTGGVPISLMGMSEPSSRFRRAHERLVALARQSNVAIYTIDVQGLDSDANSANVPLSGDHEGPPDRSVFALAGNMATKSKDDAMRALAGETGGRAILRYNYTAMDAPFEQIARDNGSFYLLGFRPESTDTKKFRNLKVRVKCDDVQVFARLGYGGDARRNATMAATLARAWDGKTVADLLDRPLPGRSFGLPMRASASVIRRSDAGATALLMVEVEPGAIPSNATKLDVGYRAIGADGTPVAARVDSTNMQVSPRTRAAIDANGWRYLTTIDLPPGAYQVRVAAREETSGAFGTVFLDVDVPPVRANVLAIDSVLVGSSRTAATPTAAPLRELLQTWPVLPTARRAFGRDGTLVAFIQLAPSTADAAVLRVAIEDADGRVVSASTYELGAAALASGGPPTAHQVALSAMAPGDYVLKVMVTDAADADAASTRPVPFSIR